MQLLSPKSKKQNKTKATPKKNSYISGNGTFLSQKILNKTFFEFLAQKNLIKLFYTHS